MRYAFLPGLPLLPTFLLAALLVASCDSSPSDSGPDHDPLFPLAAGNAWVMEVTNQIGSLEPDVRLDTIVVTRDTLVDGERWFEFSSRMVFGFAGALNSSNWYTLRDDGLWRLDAARRAIHILTYPSEVGTTTSPRPGISYTRIAEDTLLAVEGLGKIRTIPYAVRFRDGYEYNGGLGTTYVLDGDTTVVNYFSSEYGFIEIGGYWARVDIDQQRLVSIGSRTHRLVAFLPGFLDESSNTVSKRHDYNRLPGGQSVRVIH